MDQSDNDRFEFVDADEDAERRQAAVSDPILPLATDGDDGSDDDSDDDAPAMDDGSDDDSDDDAPVMDDPSDDDSDDDAPAMDDPSDDDSDDDLPGSDDDSDDDDSDDDAPGMDDGSDDDSDDDLPGSDDDLDDASDDDGPSITVDQVLTIAYLYEATLDRNGEIDIRGFNFWVDVRASGASETAIAEQFLFSTEFEDRFGDPDDMSDRELVEVCYRNILDRDGDDDGIEFWSGSLAAGQVDRPGLLIAFAASVENVGGLDYAGRLTETEDGEWVLA